MASFLSGLLGPAISGATRIVGDIQGAKVNAALKERDIQRQNTEAAIKQQIAERQAQQDAIKLTLEQRKVDDEHQKNLINLALHGYVSPGGGTGSNQAIPNVAFGLEDVRPGVQIGSETYDYDPNLDPTHQRLSTQRDIAQGRNDVSTNNNIRTTSTSRENNQNTVGASVANNVRTNTTSAANNANTVNGANARAAQKSNAAGGKQSAQAQITAVRLNSAHDQVSQADDFMTAYENDVNSGKETLNPVSLRLARAAIHGSTAAEATLNSVNPRLASYVRMQHQIAAAERSYLPKGGSNSLQQTEAMLSGVGSNGSRDQISQTQQYRKSIRSALASHAGNGQGGASPDADARTADQKDWDDAVAKYGTEHVLQEVGPRP